MKKSKRLLLSILTVFMFFCTTQFVRAEEGFDIDTYDVQIIASEDGTYHVTETLDVTFKQPLHGIYINIPSRYENVQWNVNGETIVRNYSFPITNIQILSNQEASVDEQDNGVSIRLGSADRYASEKETYKISYVIHTKDLGLGGIQTFYQNIITGGWDTNINRVTFKITMPKAFDENQLYFYTDGTSVDSNLHYVVNGNVIEGSYNGTVQRGNAITVKLDLPENYFVYPTFAAGYNLSVGLAGLLLLLSILLFIKFGRDDLVVKTVEFTAPKGLTSADVGYVIDGIVDNRDIVSLIFDWANKGYLTIEEQGDDLLFTKVRELDSEARLYEQNFFDGIFQKGDSVKSSTLAGFIYDDFTNAKRSLKDYFGLRKNKIYTTSSLVLRTVLGILAGLPLAIFMGNVVYGYTYDGLLALVIGSFVVTVILAGTLLQNYAVQRWHANDGIKYGLLVGSVLVLGICYALAIGVVLVFATNFLIQLIIVIVLTTILSILSNFMLKRTNQGVHYLGKILGLKEFIMVAEKDRLEMLVKEDPQYFYHILPYAYALGISDVWSKHFKDFQLEPPTWYVGSNSPIFNYYMMNTMLHSINVVQQPIPPVKVTSGGGSFGGGGGFGGGGFSGGGFGGSSGGGW